MAYRVFHVLLAAALLTTLPQIVSAQTAKQEIEKDPTKAWGVYRLYEYDFPSPTPAPKGYTAFHINHYGRHGARYLENDKQLSECLRVMKLADENGLLTDFGKDVYGRIVAHNANSVGKIGNLSSIGWQQEQVLGPIYAKAYPEIFRAGAKIDAVATAYTRCIMTMNSFCLALNNAVPELKISEDEGLAYLDELCPHRSNNPNFRGVAPSETAFYRMDEWGKDNLTSFAARVVDYKAILGRLFKDYEFVREWSEPAIFCFHLYTIAANSNDAPTPVDFSDVFTPDEWYSLWRVLNYEYYNGYGPRRWADLPALEHFVKHTDAALALDKPSARLRFGHDTVISAMLCYLEINNWNVKAADADHLEDNYRTYLIPMASTLDFVFYKDKKGDVIVKVLLNNVEQPVTGLEPVSGPYYRWSDLRERGVKLLEAHPINLK